MATSVFDPVAYKQTTREQWQEAAAAWNRLPANGKLNATFRIQMGMTGEDPDPRAMDLNTKATHMAIEPSVAYLFKDYFAKLQLTYSYHKMTPDADGVDPVKAQFIQLGFQIQQ